MRLTKFALVIGALCLLSACRGRGAVQDVPALILNPTPESRFELVRVVTAAVDDSAVALADDALTQESSLIIERAPPRDLEDRPLTGRTLDAPIRFQLVMNGPNCVLINEADGRRWRLSQTDCAPE